MYSNREQLAHNSDTVSIADISMNYGDRVTPEEVRHAHMHFLKYLVISIHFIVL